VSPRLLGMVAGTSCIVAGSASLLVGHGSLADTAVRGALLELRGGRTACAALAGAALAVAGVLAQGLFRNPLADPGVIGTSAGAVFGGQAMLIALADSATSLPTWLAPEMALPFGCVGGALLALLAVLAVARRLADSTAVLLAGVLIGALFVALGSFLTSLAQNSFELGRALLAFTLGGVEGSGWRQAALAAPLVAAGIWGAQRLARPLDILLTGEDEAQACGLDVRRLRGLSVLWCAWLTAAATAIAGAVGFVGLVAPHVVRRLLGAAHGALLPIAALTGAGMVVICDVIARAIPATGVIPLGVVTGLIGAPLFIWLLLAQRREAWR
jgi:iron complex transport system permease protein